MFVHLSLKITLLITPEDALIRIDSCAGILTALLSISVTVGRQLSCKLLELALIDTVCIQKSENLQMYSFLLLMRYVPKVAKRSI